MPRFEVHIPAASAGFPVGLTLRVSSENWLAALKVGLDKVGGAQMAANVLCDFQEDGSVEVTDPATGKVFRIVELPAVTPVGLGPAALPAPAREMAPPPPPAAPPAPRRAAPSPGATQPLPQLSRAPAPAAPVRPPEPPPVARAPAPPAAARAPAAPAATRPPAPPAAAPPAVQPKPAAPTVVQVERPVVAPSRRIGRTPQQLHREELLADAFVRVPKMYDFKARDEALAFLLELAMEKIACEAGFVLLSHGDRLAFAVARGAKAAEVMKTGIRIPVGTGITGFCAQEVVCLAVSDVGKDPRFFSQISRAVGYETKSILCSPIARAGRVHGVMELKNRKGGSFDPGDMAVLSYVAHQAATLIELREAAQPL